MKDNKLLNAELKKIKRAAAVVAEGKAKLQLEVTRLEEVVTRLEQEALRTSGEKENKPADSLDLELAAANMRVSLNPPRPSRSPRSRPM